ncbi:hypothetical protein CXB51_035265 [Gossypium anomalum]|uniref:Pre-nudix hydrolase domain-containing protein n=1 Tax=Gossypium anomalum TaxID=47600 RepID=A0A8J6CLU1_9ROSI|nr:hypothetical protein CXB51_035265 [Gossypium anomalum]
MPISADPSEVVGRPVCRNGVWHDELLPVINDDHGGVIIEMKEHMDTEPFLPCSELPCCSGSNSCIIKLFVIFLKIDLRAVTNFGLYSLHLEFTVQGKKGVWIKLPIGLIHLVETAVKEGFRYHHAEPSYLMLVFWIPKTPSTIPGNATHRVGVGAIILNDKREFHLVYWNLRVHAHFYVEFLSSDSHVLVVQEKSGLLQGTGIWKIPTGLLKRRARKRFVAAMREVKEDRILNKSSNGLMKTTDFSIFRLTQSSWRRQECLPCYGQSNHVFKIFNCASHFVNIDFPIFLSAYVPYQTQALANTQVLFREVRSIFHMHVASTILHIQKQELEIEAAQWMPFEEYAAQPFAQKHELFRYVNELCLAKVDRGYTGFSPRPTVSIFSDHSSFLYLNNQDLDKSRSVNNPEEQN